MGCNRSPTKEEARQIHDSATRVAAETCSDSTRAELYVRLYGEPGARQMLLREQQERNNWQALAAPPVYSFEQPVWAPSNVWVSSSNRSQPVGTNSPPDRVIPVEPYRPETVVSTPSESYQIATGDRDVDSRETVHLPEQPASAPSGNSQVGSDVSRSALALPLLTKSPPESSVSIEQKANAGQPQATESFSAEQLSHTPAPPRRDWAGISCEHLAAGQRPPGEFISSRTSDSVTIEGYLIDNRGEDRSAEERSLQKMVQGQAPKDNRKWDASHLIAHMFGGHGMDNLLPMLKRLNVSYVGAVEKGLLRELIASNVYARVTVRFGADGLPIAIIHECYSTLDAREGCVNKIFEAETKLNWDPKLTLAKYLEQVGQTWSEWVSSNISEDATIH